MVFLESLFLGVPPSPGVWAPAVQASVCAPRPPAQEQACFLPSTGLCSQPAWCFLGLRGAPGRSSGCRVHGPSHSPGDAGLRCPSPPPLMAAALLCSGCAPHPPASQPSLSAPATALGAKPGVFLTLQPDLSLSVLLCPGRADPGPSCRCTQLRLCNSGPFSWKSIHRQLKEGGWLQRGRFLRVIFLSVSCVDVFPEYFRGVLLPFTHVSQVLTRAEFSSLGICVSIL